MSLRIDRLQSLREQKGWSQRELARRCGLAAGMIHKYEALQTEPTTSSLKKIAEILEVSSDYLLGLTDNPRGHFGMDALSADDEVLLQAFHREGWLGVIRLGGERLAK